MSRFRGSEVQRRKDEDTIGWRECRGKEEKRVEKRTVVDKTCCTMHHAVCYVR